MNITAMNTPIRTAVLGGRISCTWTPLYSSTVAVPAHQPSRGSTPSHCYYQHQSKRAASTTAKPSCKSLMRRPSTPTIGITGKSISTSTLLSIIRYSHSNSHSTATSSIRRASTQATSTSNGNNKNNTNNNSNEETFTSTTTANSTSPSDKDLAARLDWNSFFTLRASRRKYSLISSILASVSATGAGGQILATQNLEALGAQVMGLDPLIVLGLSTAACGAMGWLAGPFLGNGLWGLVYRKYKGSVAVKEKEFYNRIKRFRVDPSANSFANPVPDYYGEKISSVKGYRQWLKDQRAYNRKKRNFV